MKKNRGTFDQVYYHFIWSTKERVPIIDYEIEKSIKRIIFSKAKELELNILEINGTTDHIHVLLRSKPTVAPCKIAKHLKGTSSHFVNHVTLKNDMTRSLYWQEGYGVITVGPKELLRIRKYIQQQKEHHTNQDFDENLERTEK